MKNKQKIHKNSAIVMCISTVICIWSGIRNRMKLHKCAAAVMGVSGLICMYSGYRMVHPKKKKEEEA